jgi:hypothetical protein
MAYEWMDEYFGETLLFDKKEARVEEVNFMHITIALDLPSFHRSFRYMNRL